MERREYYLIVKSSITDLRSHSEKLYQGKSWLTCVHIIIFHKGLLVVVDSLDDEVVGCKTVDSFKSKVDKWYR